jgi:trehalose 6-phosphate phosphatase
MQLSGAVALAAPPAELLSGASLFLDFDGTLVDIAVRPDAVVVSERVRDLIGVLLQRMDGRVTIMSGRDEAKLRGLLRLPSLAIAGSHGLQLHWPDGRAITAQRPAALDAVLAEMADFAAGQPGILIEDKPLGAALHYRQQPEAEAACRDLARHLAERHGLRLQTGKMVVELRAPGADKGSALDRLMGEPGLAGTRPVFIGDDDTDEPAFLAAAAHGGCGILVGLERPSAARYRLENVAAALDWLDKASTA